MKENMFDVLLYLFENYMDTAVEWQPDQESVRYELLQAGFPTSEVDKAFAWLEGLVKLRDDATQCPLPSAPSVRNYTPEECRRLSTECRGFMLFLEQVGVLDTVVLMVLFNQPGQEAAYAQMEDLVFNDASDILH
jgi:Smg protein